MDNIFFALYPPREKADGIGRMVDRMAQVERLGGPRVPTERLHITLNRLSGRPGVPWGLVSAASEAVSRLAVRPFVLALNRVMSFENHRDLRPRVLTGDEGLYGVLALHGAIHDALVRARVLRGREPTITPHLTLWRDPDKLADRFIDPVTWRVDELLLIHSPYGRSRHNILGRWPLNPPV